MAGFASKHHYILIGQESTYGTPVACTKDLGLVQSADFKDSREITSAYSVSSRIAQQLVEGAYNFTGDIELQLQHGRPFEYIFGSVSHANSGSDYKHTFTIGATVPSFTLEDGYNSASDVVNTYTSSKVNEATISLEKDGILTVKLSVINKSVTVSSSASAAVVDDLPVFQGLKGSCLIGSAGAESSVGVCTKWELNVKNNITGETGMNSTIQQAIENNLEMDFSFSMLFENSTEYQQFLGGSTTPQTSVSERSVVLKATNGVAYGSGERTVYIQLSSEKINEVGHSVKVGEVIYQEFSGKARNLGTCYVVDDIAGASF